ncbi:uncharacterized protein zgc:113229 [Rhinichthys klamathensis goyatoka]|uniref:uncharacterized protein zgc:113229 n=1 Tax=Rhinichthys klamathensis goyatoka TaxID=3034132 RepID=UPI0024B617F8|nr:uncharacterized protein zgc:113229 [Rhinichthys klamathensis goyatoka]
MEELNPVSDTHALLESMLQKLQLNTTTNSSLHADMQTRSPYETGEDSSKAAVYSFRFSSKSKERDGSTSVWNKRENPWTQQSSNFEGALTPKQPVKRISKHNSGFSTKPKRPPLIWGEHTRFTSERTDDVTSWVGDNQMPRPEKMQQFSLEGNTSSNVPPLYKTESFQNPPDLLAPTLTPSSSVVEKPEVKGQSGTWSWVAVNEKIEGIRPHEQSGKTTKTSRKKWGEAKRWAQNVKERWRERHRSTMTRQRDDGERLAQNEVQSNLSSLSGPNYVNNTPTAPTEATDIHHEPINRALDEYGPASLSYMSTTSNLMEEIFSGTEWAQFLSVKCTTQDQSNEPQININQSREEQRNSKWTQNYTTDSHLGMTKPLLSESFASDKPVYNQTETSQMSVPSSHVTDLTTNTLQTSDLFTNVLQNGNLKLNESHQTTNEQSQFSQLDPNKSKATDHSDPQLMSSQVSDPKQGGTEDFIPLLDLSLIKPMDRCSIKSYGSMSRKREHWTKRRDPFKHTTQDMEDEDHSSSFMATETSDSPTSSLNSLMDSISVSSLETAVKKRRMEGTQRRVRFSEEVIILTPSYLPENDDDDDEDDDNDCPEEPSPRPSIPKWNVSLKGKSAKYKF